MFHTNRWADVFINVLDENVKEGFDYLNLIVPIIKEAPLNINAHSASVQIEGILKEIVKAGAIPGSEYVNRFICLMIEKRKFCFIDSVLERIEIKLNKTNKVLAVTLDSAVPINETFEKDICDQIMAYTGASGISLKKRIKPEILGGYRLQIGQYYFDASLREQIKIMKEDMEKAVLAISN